MFHILKNNKVIKPTRYKMSSQVYKKKMYFHLLCTYISGLVLRHYNYKYLQIILHELSFLEYISDILTLHATASSNKTAFVPHGTTAFDCLQQIHAANAHTKLLTQELLNINTYSCIQCINRNEPIHG